MQYFVGHAKKKKNAFYIEYYALYDNVIVLNVTFGF